jgi:rhodanese-related sulfurtransferase
MATAIRRKPILPEKAGLILTIIAVGVVTPLVWYGVRIARAPTIPAPAANRLVNERQAVLVDIGAAPELAVYLKNAVKWPLASIMAAQTANDLPQELRNQKLLLVCTAGIRSAQAAIHLQEIGVDATSVRGGAQQYVCAVPGCSKAVFLRGSRQADAGIPAFRESPVHEQWAVVASFFGIKAVYTLLSLAILVMLWGRRETDLSAIRWSMIFFFVGEGCCFLNVMFFFEDSMLLEHLHSVGMVLSLGCLTYGLLEGLDARLIHFTSDSRCVMMGLCCGCDKRGDVGCALRKLFLLLIPATALLAAMPLCAGFRNAAYNTRVLGLLHSYRHPVVHQLYELRYLPVLAVILLAGSFLALWLVERRPVPYSKILFSAAVGAMGFSLLRLMLVAPFADNQVWFAFWEETTEVLYVGLVGAVLLFFQRGLLAKQPPGEEPVAA